MSSPLPGLPTNRLKCTGQRWSSLLSIHHLVTRLKWHSGKEFTWECRGLKRHRFDPWVGKIPWRRKWQPIPVFLPGNSHGQRSLVGYSPHGRKDSNMTDHVRARVCTCTHTNTQVECKCRRQHCLLPIVFLPILRVIMGLEMLPTHCTRCWAFPRPHHLMCLAGNC